MCQALVQTTLGGKDVRTSTKIASGLPESLRPGSRHQHHSRWQFVLQGPARCKASVSGRLGTRPVEF